MKVVILGPVITSETSGGVAVFDEGLYDGFKNNGHDASVISIVKSININNTFLSKKNRPFLVLLKKRKIGNIIKQIKPDLVISSLHYSLGVKTYKRIYNKCTYVQVLHGFSCPINGKLKANMVNKSIRRASKYFDHNVAVSYLTYSINKKINNTLCDAIIHNGCNFSPEKLINRDKDRLYDFVYVGRLYKDKEIESISEAFINAKKRSPNLKFAVAGYGELENLFVNGKYKCEEIDFLGKLSQEQVENLFKSSKFFVSLNPLEPFGIVFAEAVVNGCNIVTQSTCGFSYLFGKKNYFHYADYISSSELSNLLLEIVDNFYPIDEIEIEHLKTELSYKNVALEYEKLVNKGE